MVEPIANERAVDRASRALRARLFDGTWPAGSRLPPERALAEELGVNRLTLRAALSGLESRGLVRARQGAGVEVLDVAEHAGLDVLPDLIAAGHAKLLPELLRVRRAVAAEAVACAAERATPADLEDLEDLAAAQADEPDPQTFLRRDLEFARRLVRAAGSLPMQLLLNGFAPLYADHPRLARALFAQVEAIRASYLGVVALVRLGDPAAAREAVQTALSEIDTRTAAALAAPEEKQ